MQPRWLYSRPVTDASALDPETEHRDMSLKDRETITADHGKDPREEQAGGFPARLADIIGDLSIRAFARKARVSDTFLRQCLAGRTEPTRLKLLALAAAGGVSIEWLATGGGPRVATSAPTTMTPPELDRELLERAIAVVEEVLGDSGRVLEPARKALLVTAAYELHLGRRHAGSVSREEIAELVARAD